MIADALLYGILFWYLNAVVTFNHGIPRKWSVLDHTFSYHNVSSSGISLFYPAIGLVNYVLRTRL